MSNPVRLAQTVLSMYQTQWPKVMADVVGRRAVVDAYPTLLLDRLRPPQARPAQLLDQLRVDRDAAAENEGGPGKPSPPVEMR
jgi:hypothetical protein